ncbi:TPR repeat-containing protein [Melioribacter roseus P3M-2]|uniref:TPR repeat-containing protein n=1 Tax=Melioribacter roseus (strain DSM 23840 / JCM 17771 / VKM B-2668 / P3M-2) TaxID=1191523 RepID=I6ZZQ6_MELRP|nr:tetratricopeptide repeat protein [Melioribacter roseus]AFN74453.1 TPR repeat-containing protein [Melioribacter roseus P3M-2]
MKRSILYKILLVSFLVLPSVISGQDAETKYKLAQNYERSGNFEKAENLLNELIEQQPWNYSYFNSLYNIYIKQKKYDEAVGIISQRLTYSPNDPSLYGLMGSVYFMKEMSDSAYFYWDKGIETNPSSISTYRIIANYAIESRALDRALEYLKMGRQLSSDKSIFTLDLANIYSLTLRYKEATLEYCYLLSIKPDQIGLVKTKFNSYSGNKKALDEITETLESYYKENPQPIYLDLIAYCNMLNGNYNAALNFTIEYEKKINGNGASIYSMAQTALRSKAYDAALTGYRYIVDNFPGSNIVPIAKISRVETLRAKLNKNPKNDLWHYAKIIDTVEYKRLSEEYKKIAGEYVNSNIFIQALYSRAEIEFENLRNYRLADSIFTIINLRAPGTEYSAKAFLKRGLIAIYSDNLEQAKTFFDNILLNNKLSADLKAEAYFRKAKIDFWQNYFESALSNLKSASGDLSSAFANDAIELSALISTLKRDSSNLAIYAKSDLFAFQKKYEEAVALLKDLIKRDNLFILKDFALYRLAEVNIYTKSYGEALEYLKELTGKSENGILSDKALLLTAQIYQYGLKDESKAGELYENFLEKYPDSLYLETAIQNLNYIQTKKGKDG